MQLLVLGLILLGVAWGVSGLINDDSESNPGLGITRPLLTLTWNSPANSQSPNQYIRTTTLQRTVSIVRVIPQFRTRRFKSLGYKFNFKYYL